MHYRQAVNIITQTMRTADRLGATAPSGLRKEVEKLNILAEKVRAQAAGQDVRSLSEAVLAALEADSDIATDPGVQAAIVRQTVQATSNGIEDAMGRRAVALLLEHGENMLAAFSKSFDAHAAAVTAAAQKFGDISPEDTDAILSRGGDAAQVWAAAQDASKVIGDIRQTWKMLAHVSSSFTTDPRYVALTIADIPPADFVEQGINGWVAPWELARRGFPLSLATPTTYRQRVAGIHEENAGRNAEQRDAVRQAYRQTHGMAAR